MHRAGLSATPYVSRRGLPPASRVRTSAPAALASPNVGHAGSLVSDATHPSAPASPTRPIPRLPAWQALEEAFVARVAPLLTHADSKLVSSLPPPALIGDHVEAWRCLAATAAKAFCSMDLLRATRHLLANAKGSFGLVTSHSLESDEAVVVAARGQTMSIACYPQQGLVLFGSEVAATKVAMGTAINSSLLSNAAPHDDGRATTPQAVRSGAKRSQIVPASGASPASVRSKRGSVAHGVGRGSIAASRALSAASGEPARCPSPMTSRDAAGGDEANVASWSNDAAKQLLAANSAKDSPGGRRGSSVRRGSVASRSGLAPSSAPSSAPASSGKHELTMEDFGDCLKGTSFRLDLDDVTGEVCSRDLRSAQPPTLPVHCLPRTLLTATRARCEWRRCVSCAGARRAASHRWRTCPSGSRARSS